MIPYLTVISDSFRAAFSSRILWIAFAAIWLFLLALAPIGYHEVYTTTFRWFDLDNGTQMKAMLARGLVDPQEEQTALGRIARSFPEGIKRDLRQVAEGEDIRIQKNSLADSLNEALDDESWYDAEAWKSTVRLKELRELDALSEEDFDESLRRRRARLRIEAALPGIFFAQSARSVVLSYAGFDFPASWTFGKEQFIFAVNQLVLPIIMNWLLGFALIFLGILVTASIIPDMLQPGSLHLLLSKPISRTLLLLSKFVGGCVFFFLSVCQLVIGLYLIAGYRLDLWNPRILWCIPVAVFLFAVFFSVSTLAGLFWRSPTLSISVTCLFGAAVLVIGLIGGYFDAQVCRPDRIAQMAFDGPEVIIATRGNGLKKHEKDSNEWKAVIEGDSPRRDVVIPPVRIPGGKMVTARIQGGRFNLYGSGSLDLLVLNGEQDWEPLPSLRLPTGTRKMDVIGGWLLALNNSGLMATTIHEAVELTLDEVTAEGDAKDGGVEGDNEAVGLASGDSANEATEDGPADPSKIGVTAWISDLLRMQGGATESFPSILPDGVTLNDPTSMAVVPGTRSLIVYSRGRLMQLQMSEAPAEAVQPQDAVATLTAERAMDEENVSRVVLAVAGDSLLMIRGDEPVRWFRLGDLEEIAQSPLPQDLKILSAEGLEEAGCFATLAEDGRVRVATRQGQTIRWTRWALRDVTAIRFDRQAKSLAVAHHIDSIDWIRPAMGDAGPTGAMGETIRTLRPTLTSWRSVNRYLVTPLRTVTPQTGELGETVAAIVGGKSTISSGSAIPEQQDVVRLKVLRPVLSCGAFTLVMLGISCLYFSRRNF